MKNYTWVQLIDEDEIVAESAATRMVCEPKTQPVPYAGGGLDTNYPYDTKNPTRDSPPVELTGDATEISRKLAARIYLLWTSGKSNSIAVPLGYVAWRLSARAIRRGEKWELREGEVGLDGEGFHASGSYPEWDSLVPYSGVLTCH